MPSVCISISPALADTFLCPPPKEKKQTTKTPDSIVFTMLGIKSQNSLREQEWFRKENKKGTCIFFEVL